MSQHRPLMGWNCLLRWKKIEEIQFGVHGRGSKSIWTSELDSLGQIGDEQYSDKACSLCLHPDSPGKRLPGKTLKVCVQSPYVWELGKPEASQCCCPLCLFGWMIASPLCGKDLQQKCVIIWKLGNWDWLWHWATMTLNYPKVTGHRSQWRHWMLFVYDSQYSIL